MRRRFLTRYTAIALFAMLAGQFAVAGHAAVAHHDLGEQCEACVGGDRLGYGPVDPPATVLPPAAQPAAATPVSVARPCFPPRSHRARAPPTL